MRVGDCNRKRVGRIGAGDRCAWKQPGDHCMDLSFFRSTGSDDRFLDECRRIFANLDSGASRAHEHDSSSLTELECGLWVLVDEDFLDTG